VERQGFEPWLGYERKHAFQAYHLSSARRVYCRELFFHDTPLYPIIYPRVVPKWSQRITQICDKNQPNMLC